MRGGGGGGCSDIIEGVGGAVVSLKGWRECSGIIERGGGRLQKIF